MEPSNKNAASLSPAVRISLALLIKILMLPIARCCSYVTTAYSGRNGASFVPAPHSMTSLHHRRNRRIIYPLMATDPTISFDTNSDFLLAVTGSSTSPVEAASELSDNLQVDQLDPTTTVVVFIIGIIPFIWATWEFWRRIAVGASFGTGSDSVIIPSPFEEEDENDLITIGEDGNPLSSRGRRTLDRGALTVAYVLFAVAGGSVVIAVASVLMAPQVPP